MPVTTKLSREVAEPIFDGYLEKPCIKCGQDHPAINHKGPGMSGSVWRTLTGDELNLAEKYLIDLRNDYAKEQKKRRAKKLAAGNSDQQQPALVTSPIVPPVCIAPATSAHAGGSDPYATTATADLKDIYGQDLEEEVQIELPEKNGAPGKTNVSPGELFSSTRLPNPTTGSQYPLRTSFATPTSEVLTNHFEITWKENTQFYVYEILEIPASKSKRQLKTIVKAAIEAWDFLRDNKDFFTTDYIKTIVAWKNLHGSINCPRKDVLNETQWTPEPLADGERRMNLAFKYHGTLNLDRLKQFIHPSSLADDSADTTLPNFNFDPLITHLNNVISKSLSDDVFQTSAHRFYFKNGYGKLGQSNTLCVMRGYEYTVKSAMEKVLLNVNAATSAFFLPITVAEFMKDGSTFAKNELEKRIKGLKVYIVPQRQDVNDVEEQKRVENLNKAQNRIKTIKSFGKPIGTRTEKNFKFHKWVKNADGQSVEDPNETHVIEHMQAVFGRQHFINEELKAVNVGSDDDPIWYPQEFLRILPNQMYNNLLPDRLVESMLKLACKEPAEIRARIESEGLLGLGIDRLNKKQAFVSHSAHYITAANSYTEEV
jgi:eukaryotic translation initiation factor 2C